MNSHGYPEGMEKSYLLGVEDLLQVLGTTNQGLTSDEAALRQVHFGVNQITEEKATRPILLLARKFLDPLIVLLLISAFISLMLGEQADALGISIAVLFVVLLGFYQEFRSEKSIESLKKLIHYSCRVLRDGMVREISSSELVPGDMVLLGSGERISADLRIIESNNLLVDESLLTGESKPVVKTPHALDGEKIPLAERKNMAYMGTMVTGGNGRGIVVATGMATELGKISDLIRSVKRVKTPLQIKLDELGKHISLYALIVIALIFGIGFLQGRPLLEMFTIAISLAVAAIPEGLPIVVTITLALGVTRMAGRRAIVRRLPAVETLGSTSVICADKTGTLTKNEMTLTRIVTTRVINVTGRGYKIEGDFTYLGEEIDPTADPHLMELLRTGMLCNRAHLNKRLVGQPTEGALLVAAYKAGLSDEREELQVLEEHPFDPSKKWMKMVYQMKDKSLIVLKGAPERILEMCSLIRDEEGVKELTKHGAERVTSSVKELGDQGLRVLAIAQGFEEDKLIFLGLVGLMDPLREGAKESVAEAVNAGIKTIMITGDSAETAQAIAEELNLLEQGSTMLSGTEVEEMNEDVLCNRIRDTSLFYRVSPEHKLKIVQALKKDGMVVAMTGDGVNDAPALKAANIGIAMGRSGTEVAKEAAELILVDDNFSTILAAVEEGRSIYGNIKNFLRFELTTSVAAITVIALSTMAGLPLPLNPVQILWINIIMDGPPAQSLGVEPLDKTLMRARPRDPKEPIITRRMIKLVLAGAAVMVVGTLGVYIQGLKNGGLEEATSMAFTVFVMYQLFNALNCRSEEKTLTQIGIFKNKYLLLAIGASLAMQLAVLYLAPLQGIFGTVPLSAAQLGVVTVIASSVFIVDEIRKRLI